MPLSLDCLFQKGAHPFSNHFSWIFSSLTGRTLDTAEGKPGSLRQTAEEVNSFVQSTCSTCTVLTLLLVDNYIIIHLIFSFASEQPVKLLNISKKMFKDEKGKHFFEKLTLFLQNLLRFIHHFLTLNMNENCRCVEFARFHILLLAVYMTVMLVFKAF